MMSSTTITNRIKRHIDNLNTPDDTISSRAEANLIRYYGRRTVVPLLEACSHPNPVVRFRAVWALAHTHDPRAYETILRLTDDPDERVRYDATIALGILGDTRAVEPLTQMYLANDVTRPAGMAFDKIGLAAVPALARILRDGNAEVRWCVTQVLGNFAEEHGDKRSLALLLECRNDSDSSVRENAEFWIEQIQKREGQEA